jgi:homoaconitase/3-isopropylmalate dehydratase large subunit
VLDFLPSHIAAKTKRPRVAHVTPGDIVMCKVDLAMSHDSSGPRRVAPMLEELGAPIWDLEKYVVVTDHYIPAVVVTSIFAKPFCRQRFLTHHRELPESMRSAAAKKLCKHR